MTESRMQGFAAGRYAAIDIGTVTCRMLVADVDAAGAIHEVDRDTPSPTLAKASMPPVCSCLPQSTAPLKR